MEIYKNICYYKELPSTNEFALPLARSQNAEEYTVIVAENQICGRGQRGNVWVVEPGANLTFSIIIYPHHIQASKQFVISECISLAVRKVVADYCSNVTVKWPNDIYVNSKKIAGILIENTLQGSSIGSSVIGVGLNCNQKFFSSEIPNPTSICEHTTQQLDLKEILFAILLEFYTLYSQTYTRTKDVHALYNSFLFRKDMPYLFASEDKKFMGIIKAVNDEGNISIENEVGENEIFAFKEVQFLL